MASRKKQKANRVREQAVVYLDASDKALLEVMAKKTGLAKTELFRRGLRRLAAETLTESEPGSSLGYLVATAADDGFPPDVAERHDDYLFGGGYQRLKKKRAGLG